MVQPVTGPYNRLITTREPGRYGPVAIAEVNRTWWRQKRPYTIALPYSMQTRRILWQKGKDQYIKDVSDAVPLNLLDGEKQRLYNRAYESFMSNVRSAQADVLTLMRERQRTLGMISRRALDLALFVSAARKRDTRLMRVVVRNAFDGQGDRRSRTQIGIKRGANLSGGAVLEGAFGWAPLAADLSSAIQVFRKGPPSNLCKGNARYHEVVTQSDWFNDPMVSIVNNRNYGWMLRARVRCVDSDLYLLNSLGLVNVASSLWETTPWSFAVDYISNVQSFLNSFTDRLGLEFEDASSTFFGVNNATVTHTPAPWSGWPPWGYYPDYGSQFVSVTRSSGISRPTLNFRAPWRLSPQRAITSIALLLQKLKG